MEDRKGIFEKQQTGNEEVEERKYQREKHLTYNEIKKVIESGKNIKNNENKPIDYRKQTPKQREENQKYM